MLTTTRTVVASLDVVEAALRATARVARVEDAEVTRLAVAVVPHVAVVLPRPPTLEHFYVQHFGFLVQPYLREATADQAVFKNF